MDFHAQFWADWITTLLDYTRILMDRVSSAHQSLVNSVCKFLEEGQGRSPASIEDLEAARIGLHAACNCAVRLLVNCLPQAPSLRPHPS